MIIRQASIHDRKTWDRHVNSTPDASPYHLFAWGLAVEEAYHHKIFYLMAEDSDKGLQGIFPLVYISPPGITGYLVSLPYCDLGGELAVCTKIRQALVHAGEQLGRKLGAKLIDLRYPDHQASFSENRLLSHTGQSKVRMLLELPASSTELWNNFASKLRSQIRKAEKNGLEFKWGGLNQLDHYYTVFSQRMRQLGSPVHSRKWIISILSHYDNNSHMGLIYKDKKPIGAGIILNTRHTVCIPWASTLCQYNRLAPNMLLYWNLLKYSADHGFTLFDFGRSTLGEGTYRFKAQWGAKPSPLSWNYIALNGYRIMPRSSNGTLKNSLGSLWRHLPLQVANCIGPTIRKYISL